MLDAGTRVVIAVSLCKDLKQDMKVVVIQDVTTTLKKQKGWSDLDFLIFIYLRECHDNNMCTKM